MSNAQLLSKLALQFVAGIGVSKVITNIIKSNSIVLSNADMVKVWIGGVVLGSMIVDLATTHVGNRFDEGLAWYEKKKAEQAL